jgi:hypothetical protein
VFAVVAVIQYVAGDDALLLLYWYATSDVLLTPASERAAGY